MAASTARRQARTSNRRTPGKIIRNIAVVAFSLAACTLFAATVFSMFEIQDAAKLIPTLPEKMTSLSSEPTVFVSRDGKELFRISGEFREVVSFDEIPKKVINATLAAEDKRFYDHSGVDLMAVMRIGWEALFRDRTTGGSTLAMQLSKRFYTSPDRTIQRKIKDMALAVQMERVLTKDQILELYLNQVYYGDGAYGVAAAAKNYFGKELKDLTIAEAALLARLVRRPSDQNPRSNLEVAVRNRNIVLKMMLDESMITRAEYDEAVQERVKLAPDRGGDRASEKVEPYFVDYVLKDLERIAPDVDYKKGGYRIETTIDTRLQREAERQVDRTNSAYGSIRTGAAVVLTTEGRILVMVGGPSYKENQFNAAAQGRRQPGSSFKPFVYLVAARQGVVSSPWSSVDNTQVTYRDGRRLRTVKGGGPYGWVSMETALEYSYNRAAWNTINRVGAVQVVRACRDELGFKADLPAVPSLSLGSGVVSPLEMAQAYTVFPLRGRRATAFAVERIIGPNGLPVYTAEPEYVQTSFSQKNVEAVDRCLRAVVTGGTGKAAGWIKNARGKTGTTNDNKDAWFAGYTENYVGVVWFANPTRLRSGALRYAEMSSSVMGGYVGAPTWARIIDHVQDVLGETGTMSWTNGRSYDDDGEQQERRRRRNEDDVLGSLEPRNDPPVTPQVDEEPVRPPRPDAETTGGAPANPTEGENSPPNDPASGGASTTTTPPPGERERERERRTEPPRDPPPAEPRRNQTEQVSVEICADTGQRASVFCPERVTRRFPKGSEPRSRCRAHGN